MAQKFYSQAAFNDVDIKNEKAGDIFKEIEQKIQVYTHAERQQITYWLIEHYLNLKKIDILSNRTIEPKNVDWDTVLKRINAHEPIQYLIGEVRFAETTIQVSPDVLIPRPETEEMIYAIFKEKLPKNSRILDICTGSGCIAISLAKHYQDSTVWAYDVSEGALKVAKGNCELNQVSIRLEKKDVLRPVFEQENTTFDLIVSNPPYVMEAEKEEMKPNVLQYEPHLALFVENEKPLIFYEKIASFAKKNLNKGGVCWLELNAKLAQETAHLFDKEVFEVEIKKDMFNKERFLRVYKKTHS